MPSSRARRAVSFTVAALLAAVLLYYSLQGIEWREVGRLVAAAQPGPLGAAAILACATLFLRAVRWRILLNAEGVVSIGAAFWATAAGLFGNNFLPARAGELLRSFMISSRSGVEYAYALATALSDRLADAIALVIIGAVVVLLLPARPGWFAAALEPFAVLGLIGALCIAVLPLLQSRTKMLIERAPVPQAIRTRLVATIDHGLRGMRAFHDVRRLSGFVGLTALIWSIDAVGAVVAARALGFEMSIPAALLLIAGLGLGSALPSTPGYVGIYQFVAVTVLVPFGFSRTDAIAYILIVQALSYVVIGFWGGLGLWRYRRARRSA